MGRITIGRILLIALLLRAGLAFAVQHWLDERAQSPFVIAGDAEGYWELGRKLAHGEPYSLYSPPRQVMRMPGYPVFLAAVMSVFGESFLAARLFSALIGTLAVGAVYCLGCELLGKREALIAAGLQTCSPLAWGFSVLLLSETLFALTLVVSLWCAARWLGTRSETFLKSRTLTTACLTGLGVALATYVRPSWLPALLALALWGVCTDRTKRGLLQGVVVVAAGFAALLPWAWRNHNVTGHWVVTTLWMGPSLYDGLNPAADGDSEMSFFERDRVMSDRGMSEYEMNRHYRDESLRFVREQPGTALRLVGQHAVRYWALWPNADQFRSWWLAGGLACFTIPFFACAVCGVWTLRTQWQTVLIVAGPILVFAILHMLFVGSLRYRLPGEYPLALAAAVCLSRMMSRWSSPPVEGSA